MRNLYCNKNNEKFLNLPQEYEQVEYIQNDGFGYIDTGCGISASTKAIADFQIVENFTEGYEIAIFGVWNTEGRLRAYISTKNVFSPTTNTFSQTEDLTLRTTVEATPEGTYTSTNEHIYIFAQNNLNTKLKNNGFSKIRIYSMQIYEGDEIIRNYTPAKRKIDKVFGLYDLVNNVFYTEKNDIPDEYQRVEYIESTGTQYINSNYSAILTTNFVIDFLTNNSVGSTNNGAIFGGCDSSYKHAYVLETYTNDTHSEYLGRFNRGENTWSNPKLVTGQRLHFGYSKNSDKLLFLDGSYETVTKSEDEVDNYTLDTPSLYIFAYNYGDTVKSLGKTKLYHLIFLENARIIHEYIPVIRKSDNKPGLYDVANLQQGDTIETNPIFLTNDGDDEFLYGEPINYSFTGGEKISEYIATIPKNIYIGNNNIAKKVNKLYIGDDNNIARQILPKVYIPYEYQQVEYIESTGTQYINTGLLVSSDLGFEITFSTESALASSGHGVIFGAENRDSIKLFKLTTYSSSSSYKGSFERRITTAASNTRVNAGITLNQKLYCKLIKRVFTDCNNSSTTLANITINITNPIYLFAVYNEATSTVAEYSKTKLYNLKLYYDNSEEPAHNYYPCYRKSDGEPGLYDIVATTNKFLTNAGTGIFLVGEKYEAEL